MIGVSSSSAARIAPLTISILPYTRFRRVVEFGCGTGSYSRILLHTLQPEALLLNDLCREMEECVKELCDGTTVQFVPGDAEAIDFPGETDLITSCSTLQWFNDPGAFFTRCQTLRHGGNVCMVPL